MLLPLALSALVGSTSPSYGPVVPPKPELFAQRVRSRRRAKPAPPAAPAAVGPVAPAPATEAAPTPPPAESASAASASSPEPAASPSSGLELEELPPEATSPPPPASPLAPPPPPAPASHGTRLTWRAGVGFAAGGLAALAVGAGAYLGLQAAHTRDEVRRGAGGTPQVQAKLLYDDANAQTSRANVLFLVSGGLCALGAVLVGLDLTTDESLELTVSGGEGHAALTARASF